VSARGAGPGPCRQWRSAAPRTEPATSPMASPWGATLPGWSWPEYRARVARNHQVLVGRDHSDRAGAFVGTDDRVVARVPLGIEADAEMLEAGTRFPAHRRGMLADPAREHERVDPAQNRSERADVLAELMAEELDRLGGRRLTCARGEQRLHVRADTGHA